MDGQGLRMCRFTRDGIPELGEYLESVDGTGICKLTVVEIKTDISPLFYTFTICVLKCVLNLQPVENMRCPTIYL